MKTLKAVQDQKPRDVMRMMVFDPLERLEHSLRVKKEGFTDANELHLLSRRLRAVANAIDERLKLDQGNETH